MHEMVVANRLLTRAQERCRKGEKLTFRPIDGQLAVAGVHDAGFGQQPNGSSQCGMVILLSSVKIFSGKDVINLVDWSSKKINRVVKSTLASEANGASLTYDRGCHVRVMLGEILKGFQRPWDEMLKCVPYGQGTDCKSLHEHVEKTGKSCAEKRVSLDIMDIRHGIDNYGDRYFWIPTELMMADPLTKKMDSFLLEGVIRDGKYALYDATYVTERKKAADKKEARATVTSSLTKTASSKEKRSVS